MSRIGLKDWLKLLSEAGVTFSSRSYTHESAQAAAKRLELKLESADIHALRELEAHFSPAQEPNFGYLVNLFRHQQVPPRQQRIPARRPPNPVPPKPVPVPDPGSLPPWGQAEDDVMFTMAGAVVPIDWTPEDGSEPTPHKWEEWLDQLTEGIASRLWPKLVKGKWHGPPVGPLLDADFQLLDDLRDYHGLPINGMYPGQVLNSDLFAEEDDNSIDFGTRYERYDPTLAARVLKDLPNMLAAGMADKVGTLDLQLKFFFQRPRAHQIALIQNRERFNYSWARTSNTPSLVSGHCLQASIAGCTAFVALQPEEWDGKKESIAVLKRFTVDIGDRRVFAGVHYPSDNLASWYVAFNLLPRVFRKAEAIAAKDFLWDAINTKSEVFRAIKAHSADESSPYRSMVEELRRLGK
jgi:hypothetical protein